ncbi:DUF4257 domain-containing protein [Cytobacillus gottheilii]|uniref:DUF4257 domain-containing protein n=1 Tax=Cytobacillus gottheilii TaxID=859144 RepID=UPI0024947A5B|nr:DUF4257 domain-containing protein [Cytobacillus gottheilii]
MVTNLVTAAIIGGFMGLINHARRNKTILKPRNNKRTFFPGYLLDVSISATAAVAAVAFSDPTDTMKLIAIAITGGFAGEGFLANLAVENQQKNSQALKDVNSLEDSELPGNKKNNK